MPELSFFVIVAILKENGRITFLPEQNSSGLQGAGHCLSLAGNVRELEHAVRRIILTRHYRGEASGPAPELCRELSAQVEAGALDAQSLLAKYCRHLHQRLGTMRR
jgi:transcriptional regulator with GAF, ATPase, and Fis domain